MIQNTICSLIFHIAKDKPLVRRSQGKAAVAKLRKTCVESNQLIGVASENIMVIGRIIDREEMVEVLFSAHFSIFPVPYLYQEMLHIDFLALHFNHPRMFKHSPRSGTAGGFFLKAGRIRQQISPNEVEHNSAEKQRGRIHTSIR